MMSVTRGDGRTSFRRIFAKISPKFCLHFKPWLLLKLVNAWCAWGRKQPRKTANLGEKWAWDPHSEARVDRLREMLAKLCTTKLGMYQAMYHYSTTGRSGRGTKLPNLNI